MESIWKTIIIICEGKSEENYISELNRFFRENDIRIILTPKPVGAGEYKSVIKTYKNQRTDNKKSKIEIWVDFDIYLRNDNNCMDNYQKKKQSIPDFLFNHQNFEDFLVLHKDDYTLQNWLDICRKLNHFSTPLHGKGEQGYMNLLENNIFPGYKKGDLPLNINKDSLVNLLKHNMDKTIPLKSDFADFLSKIIDTHILKCLVSLVILGLF